MDSTVRRLAQELGLVTAVRGKSRSAPYTRRSWETPSTYSALTAASAGAIVWAGQYVHSHILPAFATVTAVLDGIG